jgi:hypothetical protein
MFPATVVYMIHFAVDKICFNHRSYIDFFGEPSRAVESNLTLLQSVYEFQTIILDRKTFPLGLLWVQRTNKSRLAE